jgi:valyl-tRNA synthetase
MPFLTEEIWHALYDDNTPAKSIALTHYPQADQAAADETSLAEMSQIQSLIIEVRALRKEIGVEEKAITPIEVRMSAALHTVVKANSAIVERLARANGIRFVDQITVGLAKHSTPEFDVAVVYERTIDVPAERERLTRDITKYEKGLAAAERQLGNESFLSKAPAQVVEGLRKQESETRILLEKAHAALSALPGR